MLILESSSHIKSPSLPFTSTIASSQAACQNLLWITKASLMNLTHSLTLCRCIGSLALNYVQPLGTQYFTLPDVLYWHHPIMLFPQWCKPVMTPITPGTVLSKALSPEGSGHPRLIKHGDNTLFHRPITPLCNTILLKAIPDSVLSLDAMLNAEHLKLPGHVLSTLVIPQSAQFCPSVILSPSLELLECSKGLRFSLQEVL